MDQEGNERKKRNTEGKISETEQALVQKQDVCGPDNFTHPSSSSGRVLPEYQQPLQAKKEPHPWLE